jgi:hypothetical protein
MNIMRALLKLRKWVWSPLLAFVERKISPKLYEQGKEKLVEAKARCNSVDEYMSYAQELSLHWTNDPLNGAIDFTSYPEITIAKCSGDCDDLARLAIEVLKDNYEEIYEVYCFSGLFDGHVMALFFDGHRWQLISNTVRIYEAFSRDGVFENAARAFHGGRLKFYHVERMK